MASYEGQTEKITDSVQIAHILKQLEEQRTLLTITIPGGDARYNSTLLDHDPGFQYILLDELAPNTGHQRFIKQKQLHAYGRLNGVDIHFPGRLITMDADNKAAIYRLQFPDYIHYQQRRNHYRVPVGRGLAIPVIAYRENSESVSGELCDLSQGGLGVRFEGDVDLRIGEQLQRCIINLPNNETIVTSIEVCSMRGGKNANEKRFGGKFLNLPSKDQKAISKIVTNLQREQIRNR